MRSHTTIRAELERKLAALNARVSKIERHLRNPGDPDSQEQATQLEDDEVLVQLDQSELNEIDSIKQALARIDSGSYGECQTCGASIAAGRLQALPYTATCIACAG